MTTVPIVFAFDNNLAMPAAVCIFSLLSNAKATTAYDIFVLKRDGEELDLSMVERVLREYPRHRLTVRSVGDTFDGSFEIRGITTPAYYRLLIPSLIPEYDKVIYSDVDVIFRDDLSSIYSTELGDSYFGGVKAGAHLDKDLNAYYTTLGLNSADIIYSGNLLINSALLRNESDKTDEFRVLGKKTNYKFQDMDIINISCRDRIKFLPPSFCLSTYIAQFTVYKRDCACETWGKTEICKALRTGLVHYNGRKPWQGYCINFDIWWEYYRKSPVFDEKFYFDFFYGKLDELDRLPLMKRIKILLRYFVYGKK